MDTSQTTFCLAPELEVHRETLDHSLPKGPLSLQSNPMHTYLEKKPTTTRCHAAYSQAGVYGSVVFWKIEEVSSKFAPALNIP